MPRIDLTPFGFTPTESLVYEVLLTGGPGTGYAVARGAGLARANAYSALEALVRNMLRPILKDWLDEHLPEIVEELVTREIARITGKNR